MYIYVIQLRLTSIISLLSTPKCDWKAVNFNAMNAIIDTVLSEELAYVIVRNGCID
jgi:hypothetical protein